MAPFGPCGPKRVVVMIVMLVMLYKLFSHFNSIPPVVILEALCPHFCFQHGLSYLIVVFH